MGDANVVHLGLEARGTFLVQVTANGFDPVEFKVFFARGHMQTVIVKMRRVGSSDTAGLERVTNLNGQVLDHTGSLITTAKIVAVGTNGRRFETTSGPNGYFQLALSFNGFFWNAKSKHWVGDSAESLKYDISVAAPGFSVFESKQLVITNGARGSLNMDVVLEPLKPSPGGAFIRK